MSFLSINRSLFGFSRGIFQNIIMGKSGKPGFYAVRRGRSVGVYRTWDECKSNVDKFVGARHKKFSTEEEAWQFVNDSTPQKPAASNRYQPYNRTTRSAQKTTYNNGSAGSSHSHYSTVTRSPYNYNATQAVHDTTRQTRARNFAKRQYSDDATTSQRTHAQNPHQHNDRVAVYTDGACSFNGQKGARAGVGVYWGNKHADNVSQRLKGRQTNQRAEITAATMAVEKARSKGIKQITLYTDSKYTINCKTSWMDKWKRNGWQTVNNKDVHNKPDLMRLDKACEDVDVQWEYVPGHQNVAGNEAADKLATSGAQLPYTYPTKKNRRGDDEFYDDSDSDEWGY